MSRSRSNFSVAKLAQGRSGLRMAAVLFCLLVATAQSFIAQTHVHASWSQQVAEWRVMSAAVPDLQAIANARDFSPSRDTVRHARPDGASSCPLCQIVLHAAAAFALAYLFCFELLTARSVFFEALLPRGAQGALSFNWQGRAPPRI